MDEPKSKSQKKREAEALQAFGIRLIDRHANTVFCVFT